MSLTKGTLYLTTVHIPDPDPLTVTPHAVMDTTIAAHNITLNTLRFIPFPPVFRSEIFSFCFAMNHSILRYHVNI